MTIFSKDLLYSKGNSAPVPQNASTIKSMSARNDLNIILLESGELYIKGTNTSDNMLCSGVEEVQKVYTKLADNVQEFNTLNFYYYVANGTSSKRVDHAALCMLTKDHKLIATGFIAPLLANTVQETTTDGPVLIAENVKSLPTTLGDYTYSAPYSYWFVVAYESLDNKVYARRWGITDPPHAIYTNLTAEYTPLFTDCSRLISLGRTTSAYYYEYTDTSNTLHYMHSNSMTAPQAIEGVVTGTSSCYLDSEGNVYGNAYTTVRSDNPTFIKICEGCNYLRANSTYQSMSALCGTDWWWAGYTWSGNSWTGSGSTSTRPAKIATNVGRIITDGSTQRYAAAGNGGTAYARGKNDYSQCMKAAGIDTGKFQGFTYRSSEYRAGEFYGSTNFILEWIDPDNHSSGCKYMWWGLNGKGCAGTGYTGEHDKDGYGNTTGNYRSSMYTPTVPIRHDQFFGWCYVGIDGNVYATGTNINYRINPDAAISQIYGTWTKIDVPFAISPYNPS